MKLPTSFLTVAGLIVMHAGCAIVAPMEARADQASCAVPSGESAFVAQVLDGETLLLGGAVGLRLVGALAPRAYDSGAITKNWPIADMAKAALTYLVAGKSIVYRPMARPRADRHGRLVAQVYVLGESGEQLWVQGEMVVRGVARAYALPGDASCLAELLDRERLARANRVGMWREAAYAVRAAGDTDGLLTMQGTYQIVEGRVYAVAPGRTRVYVNFDRNWRRDFTIVARGRAMRAVSAGGFAKEFDWGGLKGRVIRVRGWIERRGGPLIEISDPREIEVLAPETAEASVATQREKSGRQ